MPKVILILPNGDPATDGAIEFVVAPQVGEGLLLNVGSKRRPYVVDEVFHGMASDGSEMLYFARVSRAAKAQPPIPRADPQF